PWPGAAKPASLPVYPLHRAYLRPSWLTGLADQNQKQKHGGLKADLSVKSKGKSQSESRAAFL
ncbi:hypothetical protein C1X88_31460, partial [Pseudomonas sp. GP01-A13]